MEDVVIIGAGPGGLFAACELARHGVRARVLEQMPQPHHQARGTAIQPATLEMLARAGVVDDFLRFGAPMYTVRMCGPDLSPLVAGSLAGIDCAYELQCCLPQWRTEEILTAHLERLGGRIERAIRVTDIAHADDHVQLRIERADGSSDTIHTRYLIGAGGAHSITRAAMDEKLVGETYAGHYVVADARVSHDLLADEATIVVGPGGVVLLAPLPDQRRLIFVDVSDDKITDAEPPSGELVATLLKERIALDVGVHDICWASHFRMHKRMTRALTDRRCFLVGDAAHLSSPFGGEGLNAALHDAVDIAWKLALVLQERGRPVLLDSYSVERGMADRHALTVSDEVHASVMELRADLAGGRTPHIDAPDADADRLLMRRRSMLDVSYPGSPLIGEHVDGVMEGPAPGERYPDRRVLEGTTHHLIFFGPAPNTVPDFTRRWAGLVEVVDGEARGLDPARAGVPAAGGAVLIRPDGYIGFRTVPADAAGMEALERHLDGYLTAARLTNAAGAPH